MLRRLRWRQRKDIERPSRGRFLLQVGERTDETQCCGRILGVEITRDESSEPSSATDEIPTPIEIQPRPAGPRSPAPAQPCPSWSGRGCRGAELRRTAGRACFPCRCGEVSRLPGGRIPPSRCALPPRLDRFRRAVPSPWCGAGCWRSFSGSRIERRPLRSARS
jgi:hypothetical protein